MYQRINYFLLVSLLVFFVFTCKDDPTSSDDENLPLNDTTGTVTDIDGNIYKTVKIGNQWWMAENLKVTHYQNGDSIPNVTDGTQWTFFGLTTGAYCNYDNDTTHVATYGRLYNWYAVDDSRNIAPAGWHVPSDAEWQTLVDSLGDSSVAGGKMKITGTIEEGDGLWHLPNAGATNESGFSALPGGHRGGIGFSFTNIGYAADFWSSSEYYDYAWSRHLFYYYSDIGRHSFNKRYGFSIRCVRDQPIRLFVYYREAVNFFKTIKIGEYHENQNKSIL